MKKVKSIRLWFENCELVEFDIQSFDRVVIENVGVHYESFHSSGGICIEESYHAYGRIFLCWREDVRNGRWLNFRDKTELPEGNPRYYDNLERLRRNDITSIVLCYEDGTEKKIAVPFKPTNVDAVESSLQSTTRDGKGRWEIEILPDGE